MMWLYSDWDVTFRVYGGNDVAILSGMWLYSLRDVAILKFDYSVSSTELDKKIRKCSLHNSKQI